MQTPKIPALEDVNGEHCPKLISAKRPINISSVRAASLRASGLRAAACAASSRRTADTQKENKSVATNVGERNASVNQQSYSSSTVSMASSTNLSYTNSQEPGEDSQLNVLAMVDKLVDLNASLMWQKPESSVVAGQSFVKGSQSIKGLQSLARHVDMKIQQVKIGIYDWIDSQPEDGDLKQEFLTVIAQQKQLEACKPMIQQKGMMCDLAGASDASNSQAMAEDTSLRKQRNMGNSLCQSVLAGAAVGNCAKEGSTYFAHQPLKLTEELGIGSFVTGELHDADASYDKGEAETMDIGASTQIALEAIDIMRHGILMENASGPCNEKEAFSSLDIGKDTQIALDAIDFMRQGIGTDLVLPKGESSGEIEQGLHFKGSAKRYASEEDWQAKVKLSPMAVTSGRKKWLLSSSPADCKQGSNKGFSKRASNTALFKPAGPDSKSNKRFLLDFSSAMVPRRKRSRLCGPRGSVNENIVAFGWQAPHVHLHKPHQNADKQTHADKVCSVELQKSALCPKQEGNSKELAVLTESTNGEFCSRRMKKGSSTKSDYYTLPEQSRKRRKCEFRCMFVLFSHSLSEATIKEQKKILRKLGGHVASSAAKATHFVADSFARSRNMLEIMAAGKAVVTTMWLEGCCQAEYFVDEKSYILQDVQKEKDWGFCMHSSLAASRRKPLLKGLKVVVSPNAFPDIEAMKTIIESSGGQALQKLCSSFQSKAEEIASVSFVIAAEVDYGFCVEFLRKGCKVYSAELILHGVVVQNLDFSRNRLFEDYLQ